MDNNTTINNLRETFLVTFNYGGGKEYPAASFPTKELAEGYVRFSQMQNYNSVIVEYKITPSPFYTLDFEAMHYKNSQMKMEF